MLSFVTLIFGLYRDASNNGDTATFGGTGLEIDVRGRGANTDAKLIVKGKVTLNSNGFDGISTSIYPNTNLDIVVETGALLNTTSNGGIGLRVSFINFDSGDAIPSEFNVDVKEGGFFKSCGNGQVDIFGNPPSTSTLAFSGTGYTCDQAKVVFYDTGTVVEPDCQDCPSN